MTDRPLALYADHGRLYRENKFVYPVLSRRSGGISIGVNLNPDKVCNFDCIYCQVDRRSEAETRFVETGRLRDELDSMLDFVSSGRIYEDPKFADVPTELRRLNDIAFSGDGEPTTFRNFDEIIAAAAELKRRRGLSEVKLVLITNGTMFHRPAVERGLETLDANQGEIWAKLETGTDEYYQLVERTKIPFRQVLDNITAAARKRPLVIQSLFMRIRGQAPPTDEIDAFCDRLNEITAAGGQLKSVQVYTVARQPAESFVAPLANAELDAIAQSVRDHTGLSAPVFYGAP
ncbi:MAG TPA: radical SAM protein [Planctomycetaceae bacterium]|nr:radical SAM protein [Planctomycetaceae bacterium]